MGFWCVFVGDFFFWMSSDTFGILRVLEVNIMCSVDLCEPRVLPLPFKRRLTIDLFMAEKRLRNGNNSFTWKLETVINNGAMKIKTGW